MSALSTEPMQYLEAFLNDVAASPSYEQRADILKIAADWAIEPDTNRVVWTYSPDLLRYGLLFFAHHIRKVQIRKVGVVIKTKVPKPRSNHARLRKEFVEKVAPKLRGGSFDAAYAAWLRQQPEMQEKYVERVETETIVRLDVNKRPWSRIGIGMRYNHIMLFTKSLLAHLAGGYQTYVAWMNP